MHSGIALAMLHRDQRVTTIIKVAMAGRGRGVEKDKDKEAGNKSDRFRWIRKSEQLVASGSRVDGSNNGRKE